MPAAAADVVEFKEAERAMGSWTAPMEKRCLIWLARRMPRWVNSDHLTALGCLGMFMVGASYALARWERAGLLLAIFWLGVNWFGDSLDGTLARVRNCQRPRYGFYLDHVVDTFGALFVLGGLGLSGIMSPAIAVGLLIAYYILAIEIFLATYALGTFHLSFGKFGPTELRILLALGNLRLWWDTGLTVAGRQYLFFDVAGAIGIAGLLVAALVSVFRHTRRLYREEPLT